MMATIHELRKEPHWSYSALHTYLCGCQLQWYFRYVEQAEVEQTAACFAFGKAFHSAMASQAEEARNGGSLTRAELTELFTEAFKVEVDATAKLRYKAGEDFDSMVQLAERMLDTALAEWCDFYTVKTVSEAFKINVPGLNKPLIGEFDLVVEEGRDRCIVDWKTSATRWPESKAAREMQPTVFSYAFRELYGELPLFRFDVVTKTKNPVYERHYTTRNEDNFDRFVFLANKVQESVNAGIFLPNESSFGCAECPYAARCKAWHRTNKNQKRR
jgi:putative RecB family exonuclease